MPIQFDSLASLAQIFTATKRCKMPQMLGIMLAMLAVRCWAVSCSVATTTWKIICIFQVSLYATTVFTCIFNYLHMSCYIICHLYINSHNSDPLWVKSVFWIRPPGNHEKPIKIRENHEKSKTNQRKSIKIKVIKGIQRPLAWSQ